MVGGEKFCWQAAKEAQRSFIRCFAEIRLKEMNILVTKQQQESASPFPLNAHRHHQTVSGQFCVTSHTWTFQTGGAPHFIDLTEEVSGLVTRSGILCGQVHVFSKHTTAAIVVNEQEPMLLSDIGDLLARLVPATAYYRHDDLSIRTVNLHAGVEDQANGHAHCQHLFLGSSCHLPILNRCLDAGQWQRIFLVELDSPRIREVVVQISGVKA